MDPIIAIETLKGGIISIDREQFQELYKQDGHIVVKYKNDKYIKISIPQKTKQEDVFSYIENLISKVNEYKSHQKTEEEEKDIFDAAIAKAIKVSEQVIVEAGLAELKKVSTLILEDFATLQEERRLFSKELANTQVLMSDNMKEIHQQINLSEQRVESFKSALSELAKEVKKLNEIVFEG